MPSGQGCLSTGTGSRFRAERPKDCFFSPGRQAGRQAGIASHRWNAIIIIIIATSGVVSFPIALHCIALSCIVLSGIVGDCPDSSVKNGNHIQLESFSSSPSTFSTSTCCCCCRKKTQRVFFSARGFFYCVTLHYVTLRCYITLRYIALRYIALHTS